MAVEVTVAMAASLIFLLLLPLAQATVSSAAIPPTPKTINFIAKDVRTSIKESAMDYMELRAQQGSSGQQVASAKADTSGALVFNLSVGTSPQTIPVVMDITTELVWAQCDPCPTCARFTPPATPTFLPSNSDSVERVRCASETCQRMIPGDHGCDHDSDLCRYSHDFYGAANTSGFLLTDTFRFGTTTSVADVVFGCSYDYDIVETDLGGASGFAGFGRGPLSLVSQLNMSSFTYFIAPLDDPASKSFVSWSWGADDDLDIAAVTGASTPLQEAAENQRPHLYYVKLIGVQIDGQLLSTIPEGTFDVEADGSGGVFLSTTLPVTYLEQAAYTVLRQELVSRLQSVGMAPVNAAGDLRHLCVLTKDFTIAKVPRLALLFNGTDAVMELKVENYFLAVSGGLTCLTILPSSSGSVLGSLLQAGRNITYDIHGGQLMFQTAATKATAGGAPTTTPERVSLLMIVATLLVLLLGPTGITAV